RLGNLIVGDGLAAKTLVWAPAKRSSMILRSLIVKSGSTFAIGSSNDSTANDIGNATASGVPTLMGGVVVEAGASLNVQDFPGGSNSAALNLEGGGIHNDGTVTLFSRSNGLVQYTVHFGGFNVSAASATQVVSGDSSVTFADIIIGGNDTLAVQRPFALGPLYTMALAGRLLENPEQGVSGAIVSSRNVGNAAD